VVSANPKAPHRIWSHQHLSPVMIASSPLTMTPATWAVTSDSLAHSTNTTRRSTRMRGPALDLAFSQLAVSSTYPGLFGSPHPPHANLGHKKGAPLPQTCRTFKYMPILSQILPDIRASQESPEKTPRLQGRTRRRSPGSDDRCTTSRGAF